MGDTAIHLDQVCFRYLAQQALALDHVSLHIARGEFVVLTGPSGCGKSTLALAIGGYLGHQFKGELTGTVKVAGVDPLAEPLYRTADVVGLVQQNPEDQFCTLRVDDEVAFGPENRRVEPPLIRELVEISLLRARALRLRGRSLDTLSGGEKQRVALASMLVGEPQVLILDEPTSSLDPQATREVLDVLDAMRQERGLTLIVIEHKLDALARYTPRVVRMSVGRIVEDGATIELMPSVAREPSAPGSEALALNDVSVELDGCPVLQAVDARFHSGQLTALMGANGAGKTTLLRVMRGLQNVSAGTVAVLGQAHEPRSVSLLADRVAYMFQNPDHQLLGDTVMGDLTYGLDARQLDHDAAYHRALLQEAGLWELRERHPFSLSYGQKRRLNLASLLAHRPEIILVDEPLIGQDPDNADYVMGVLRAAADQGACVIAALHAPSMVRRFADRVLFLERGRVLRDGIPATAMEGLTQAGLGAFQGRP